MTSDKIQETTNGLRRVNELLGKYVQKQALSFGEKRELWLFYKEHEDTNALIDCAVAMAGKDLDLLFSDAQLLLKEAEVLIGIYKSSVPLFSSFDTKADCKEHLKPFEDAWEEMKEKAHAVWMELQRTSNRLDFMDYSDPEFKSLDEKCDSLRAEYNKLQNGVNELFGKYRNEQKGLAGLYYFDLEYLHVLVFRLSEIASSIISDIADFREGGEA
jgi:hypothetical protein